jgi:hypothetical protein
MSRVLPLVPEYKDYNVVQLTETEILGRNIWSWLAVCCFVQFALNFKLGSRSGVHRSRALCRPGD